jgi:hypothetical protein
LLADDGTCCVVAYQPHSPRHIHTPNTHTPLTLTCCPCTSPPLCRVRRTQWCVSCAMAAHMSHGAEFPVSRTFAWRIRVLAGGSSDVATVFGAFSSALAAAFDARFACIPVTAWRNEEASCQAHLNSLFGAWCGTVAPVDGQLLLLPVFAQRGNGDYRGLGGTLVCGVNAATFVGCTWQQGRMLGNVGGEAPVLPAGSHPLMVGFAPS